MAYLLVTMTVTLHFLVVGIFLYSRSRVSVSLSPSLAQRIPFSLCLSLARSERSAVAKPIYILF